MVKQAKDEKYWEEFGKRIGKKIGESKVYYHSCCTGGSTFALLILLIGLYWLAKDMGWVKPQVSMWAIIFVIIGLYWFVKSMFRRY